jgi:hypothetical protein
MRRGIAAALVLALGGCGVIHAMFKPSNPEQERADYVNCRRAFPATPWSCESYRSAYNVDAARKGLDPLPPPSFGAPPPTGAPPQPAPR